MSKEKTKTVANPVGANCVRPHFEGKTQKGITLIALIITIIVMLILVGVSVTVALNGGLFTTAKDATNKTQLEIDKEQLLELALGAINDNGKVVLKDLDEAVAADGKFTGTDGTYTSVKSGNVFTVNEWGSVAEAPEEPEYELSGEWQFVETPDPQTDLSEQTIASQSISFTAFDYYDTEDEVVPVTTEYNSINVYLSEDDSDEDMIDFYIEYDSTWAYHGCGSISLNSTSNLFSEWYPDSGGSGDVVERTIDFGNEPQTVSKEFYEWFTANATQI